MQGLFAALDQPRPVEGSLFQNREQAESAIGPCCTKDTAKNVFMYIRLIAHIMRPGGRQGFKHKQHMPSLLSNCDL